MVPNISFCYFYGNESQQFSFYRIPKLLITDDCFKNVSTDAKLLYGLMLDRMSLSAKNNWLDEQGRVYIYYRIDEIQAALNCGHDKVIKILAELDTGKGIGLIQRVRQGQGRPTIIYVKRFTSVGSDVDPPSQSDCDNSRLLKNRSPDFGKPELKASENQTSRLPKIRGADFGKSEVSLYSKNKTEMNKTDSVITAEPVLDWDRQVAQAKKQIDYEEHVKLYPEETEDILELLLEFYTTSSTVIQICGKDYNSLVVQNKFRTLKADDFSHVLKSLHTHRSKICDRWSYLLNSLFAIADLQNDTADAKTE